MTAGSRLGERSLRAALRSRARGVELGRRDLAGALAVAETAAQEERRAVAAISEEAAFATHLEAGDAAVEAFSAWLPEGRRAVAVARERRDEAEARVVVARAALGAARGAEAATEALLAGHLRQRRLTAARGEQRRLDEAGARGSSATASREGDPAGGDPADGDPADGEPAPCGTDRGD